MRHVVVIGTGLIGASFGLALRKNGRKVASEWVHIFTIRDGKVAHFREFLDTAPVARAYQA